MEIEAWTAELGLLLQHDGSASLAQPPRVAEDGFDLHLTLKEGRLGPTFIRNPLVSNHLCAWPRTEDLVVWSGLPGGSSSPVLLIRDRALLVVSGGPGVVGSSRATEHQKTSFSSWFIELTGQPCPVELGPLVMLAENLYGPRGDTKADYKQLSWALLRRGWWDATPAPMAAVSFSGYGMSSWAVYVTRLVGRTRIALRLHHLGAYRDPEESVKSLLSNLSNAVRLQNEAAERDLQFILTHNMGSWEFALGDVTLRTHDGSPENTVETYDLKSVLTAIRSSRDL